MEYIEFNNGERFPKLGLGTYKLKGKEGQEAVETALAMGYRQLDTAQMYDNEKEVGAAIINSKVDRADVFVTTKIWPTNFTRLVEATEESLSNLKIEQIDLLLLHWPSANINDTKKGLELLNTVLQKGYAKSVGVSNFNIELINTALEMAPIVCNQVEYHALLNQQTLLEHLRKHNLSLTAYYPLAHTKLLDNVIIQIIANIYNRTPSQIVLRWLVQQQGVAAIPKSANARRQEENLDIFDFTLSDADMISISNLGGNEHFINASTAPVWDE
jgi:2,5-diketo-D-gluconate reductase B